MKRIGCVGDNCVDHYRQTGEDHFGGNPVNVAVYTRRLGGGISYVGAVGTDGRGAALLDALPCTDIAFFSDDGSDDEALRQRLRQLAALGPRIVVATRGSRGSMAYDGQRFYGQGIVPCRVVDTMGAGDSFIAGFLHSWLEGLDIPGCMASGAQCSAVTLAYEGAW